MSNPLDDPAFAGETVTNDAVAGETVIDNGNYAGPEGSEPREAEPDYAGSDLENEPIDLDLAESDGPSLEHGDDVDTGAGNDRN